MHVTDAGERIRQRVMEWEGVSAQAHRFGGIEFRLGKREIGHLHGNSLADIPFPMSVRNELIAAKKVEPHHILPDSGWISFPIRKEEDVDKAVVLFRLSFEIAREKARDKK
ncbi:MAG TPA: luciferase family protein [Bacteroidota bacterium]|nr:luciferase family protein [Bacteroidota bacterium]